jgi:hypothetical protein
MSMGMEAWLSWGYLSISVRKLDVQHHALNTKPWKKKLIHPMMIICGTIITIWVFIPDIMPSIAAGSVKGFGVVAGASPLGGPSFR